MADNNKEVWLRGPLDHLTPIVQPVAHALMQAQEEINELMIGFPDEYLWRRVAGLAAVGFHLQHIKGVISRLFTYAAAQQLNAEQLSYLKHEGVPDNTVTTIKLVQAINIQIEEALHQLIQADAATLLQPREVGRARLPSTMLGLYVHAAEHTMRHLGQLLVTVKMLPVLQ